MKQSIISYRCRDTSFVLLLLKIKYFSKYQQKLFIIISTCVFLLAGILSSNTLRGQAKKTLTVQGTVKDLRGQSLPGATILVKGSNQAVLANMDGAFSIEVPYAEATLVVSYIGYQPQEVELNGRSSLDIELKEDSQALEEAVVVGFGVQRRISVTGAISSITTKDLKQSPTANLTNALAGRLPGLIVNQFAGGEPGVDQSDIFVRGFSTYGDKSPIIVVDGIERDMRYLAPDEIETFSILKDAASTAPFGVRGANGVILITTKRGQSSGKALVNFKASVGINNLASRPKYLGSADYATLYNEAMTNDENRDLSTVKLFTDSAIESFRQAKGDNSDGKGYDWDYYDFAMKPGIQQDYSISIRGGSNTARYYVLANYFNQDGNYRHTNLSQFSTQAVFKRYNFRSNIDIDMTKNFYAKLDIGARITDRNAPGTTAGRIMEFINTQPSYYPIIVGTNDNPANDDFRAKNPLGMLFGDQIYRYNILGELSRTGFLNEKNTYVEGSFVLGHKLDFITEGLKADLTFSYDASNGRWINRTVPGYSEGYRSYPGYATFVPVDGRDVYMTPGIFDGVYTNGNKYTTDQTLGNGFARNNDNGRTFYQFKVDYARTFSDHVVTAMVLFNRSTQNINEQIPFCYQGLASRLTYSYAERYFLEANAGYNGSENFASGLRYGFFPAGSVAWVASNENFLANTRSWLDLLKFRASFGVVGNDKMPNGQRFQYLAFYGGGNGYNFGDDNFNTGYNGMREDRLANPTLTWEKSRKANVGIDLNMFKGRFSLTFDYFKEHRYDILTSLGDGKLGFPSVVGKEAPYINSGIVDNHGFEFEVGWNQYIGQLSFYIKPNFSFSRNKIVFMNEIPRDYPWRQETGGRIGQHFSYLFDYFVPDRQEADRLNAMNNGAGFQPWGRLQPGDVVYKDLNGDGVINDLSDRAANGYPRIPEIQFGIPLGGHYKNLDFSVMFQGATNTSVALWGAAVWDFPLYSQDKYGKVKPMHLDRWTPETAATATYPALRYGDYKNNKNENSSLFLYDASYIRLKTAEIGYSLPQAWIQKVGMQQVRFYAQGLNLITWDRLGKVDVDPEMREGEGNWYPVQRVINFGVDIAF